MKKFLIVIMSIVMLACSAAISACTKASSTSTAVTIDELIRDDYAAEKEAEDDKTREHPTEIPEGAEVIEKDGEEWIVINSADEAVNKIWKSGEATLSKNYILAADLNLGDNYYKRIKKEKIFRGKFDGNNYKIYSTEENGGVSGGLFFSLVDALIENVIFSSSDGSWNTDRYGDNLLFVSCSISTIRNCVNYWQPKPYSSEYTYDWHFMGNVLDSLVESCVNYADLYVSHFGGGIAQTVRDGKIINCTNYGNISGEYHNTDSGVGGIVGVIRADSVIENCSNYGKITGQSNLGGIVGIGISQYYVNEYWNKDFFPENQLIKNCKNFGDIYLKKEEGDNRVEKITWKSIYRIGGITGSATKIENCKNEGNFYGFESFGKDIYVELCGGVVGMAIEVTDCTSKNSIPVQEGRARGVGEIYGILL